MCVCVCGWGVLLNESLAIKVISKGYFDYHSTSLKSFFGHTGMQSTIWYTCW